MQLSPQTIYENDRPAKLPLTSPSDPVAAHGSGVAVLASGRAQLLLMQRRIIETLAKQKGWQTGWASVQASQPIAEIDLDSKDDTPSAEEEAVPPSSDVRQAAESLLSAPLAAAAKSLDDFRATFEVHPAVENVRDALLTFDVAIEQSCSITFHHGKSHQVCRHSR